MKYFLLLPWNRAVGLATGYGMDGRGVVVRVPVGVGFFSSPRRTHGLWGPPSLLSNGYRFSQDEERPAREGDHSPRTNVEVKNMWIYTSTPPYVVIAYCLMN
jgi:hypothetical protein